MSQVQSSVLLCSEKVCFDDYMKAAVTEKKHCSRFVRCVSGSPLLFPLLPVKVLTLSAVLCVATPAIAVQKNWIHDCLGWFTSNSQSQHERDEGRRKRHRALLRERVRKQVSSQNSEPNRKEQMPTPIQGVDTGRWNYLKSWISWRAWQEWVDSGDWVKAEIIGTHIVSMSCCTLIDYLLHYFKTGVLTPDSVVIRSIGNRILTSTKNPYIRGAVKGIQAYTVAPDFVWHVCLAASCNPLFAPFALAAVLAYYGFVYFRTTDLVSRITDVIIRRYEASLSKGVMPEDKILLLEKQRIWVSNLLHTVANAVTPELITANNKLMLKEGWTGARVDLPNDGDVGAVNIETGGGGITDMPPGNCTAPVPVSFQAWQVPDGTLRETSVHHKEPQRQVDKKQYLVEEALISDFSGSNITEAAGEGNDSFTQPQSPDRFTSKPDGVDVTSDSWPESSVALLVNAQEAGGAWLLSGAEAGDCLLTEEHIMPWLEEVNKNKTLASSEFPGRPDLKYAITACSDQFVHKFANGNDNELFTQAGLFAAECFLRSGDKRQRSSLKELLKRMYKESYHQPLLEFGESDRAEVVLCFVNPDKSDESLQTICLAVLADKTVRFFPSESKVRFRQKDAQSYSRGRHASHKKVAWGNGLNSTDDNKNTWQLTQIEEKVRKIKSGVIKPDKTIRNNKRKYACYADADADADGERQGNSFQDDYIRIVENFMNINKWESCKFGKPRRSGEVCMIKDYTVTLIKQGEAVNDKYSSKIESVDYIKDNATGDVYTFIRDVNNHVFIVVPENPNFLRNRREVCEVSAVDGSGFLHYCEHSLSEGTERTIVQYGEVSQGTKKRAGTVYIKPQRPESVHVLAPEKRESMTFYADVIEALSEIEKNSNKPLRELICSKKMIKKSMSLLFPSEASTKEEMLRLKRPYQKNCRQERTELRSNMVSEVAKLMFVEHLDANTIKQTMDNNQEVLLLFFNEEAPTCIDWFDLSTSNSDALIDQPVAFVTTEQSNGANQNPWQIKKIMFAAKGIDKKTIKKQDVYGDMSCSHPVYKNRSSNLLYERVICERKSLKNEKIRHYGEVCSDLPDNFYRCNSQERSPMLDLSGPSLFAYDPSVEGQFGQNGIVPLPNPFNTTRSEYQSCMKREQPFVHGRWPEQKHIGLNANHHIIYHNLGTETLLCNGTAIITPHGNAPQIPMLWDIDYVNSKVDILLWTGFLLENPNYFKIKLVAKTVTAESCLGAKELGAFFRASVDPTNWAVIRTDWFTDSDKRSLKDIDLIITPVEKSEFEIFAMQEMTVRNYKKDYQCRMPKPGAPLSKEEITTCQAGFQALIRNKENEMKNVDDILNSLQQLKNKKDRSEYLNSCNAARSGLKGLGEFFGAIGDMVGLDKVSKGVKSLSASLKGSKGLFAGTGEIFRFDGIMKKVERDEVQYYEKMKVNPRNINHMGQISGQVWGESAYQPIVLPVSIGESGKTGAFRPEVQAEQKTKAFRSSSSSAEKIVMEGKTRQLEISGEFRDVDNMKLTNCAITEKAITTVYEGEHRIRPLELEFEHIATYSLAKDASGFAEGFQQYFLEMKIELEPAVIYGQVWTQSDAFVDGAKPEAKRNFQTCGLSGINSRWASRLSGCGSSHTIANDCRLFYLGSKSSNKWRGKSSDSELVACQPNLRSDMGFLVQANAFSGSRNYGAETKMYCGSPDHVVNYNFNTIPRTAPDNRAYRATEKRSRLLSWANLKNLKVSFNGELVSSSVSGNTIVLSSDTSFEEGESASWVKLQATVADMLSDVSTLKGDEDLPEVDSDAGEVFNKQVKVYYRVRTETGANDEGSNPLTRQPFRKSVSWTQWMLAK